MHAKCKSHWVTVVSCWPTNTLFSLHSQQSLSQLTCLVGHLYPLRFPSSVLSLYPLHTSVIIPFIKVHRNIRLFVWFFYSSMSISRREREIARYLTEVLLVTPKSNFFFKYTLLYHCVKIYFFLKNSNTCNINRAICYPSLSTMNHTDNTEKVSLFQRNNMTPFFWTWIHVFHTIVS